MSRPKVTEVLSPIKTKPIRPVESEVPTASDSRWGEVTRGVRNGDSDCFEVLYDHFFDQIYAHVRHLTRRDESTCLDIVQEVLMKVIRAIKPIDNRAQLVAWIRVVTRTVTYDWLKKELRQATAIKQFAEQQPQPCHSESHIEDLARVVWLEEQLRNLPAETQRMLSLRYRLGWSLKRIAERFGLKTGAVDGRIRRAIKKIKLEAEFNYESDD